jgi:hypothetical protein
MMDESRAKKLVQETFENDFDKNQFTKFITQLLNLPELLEPVNKRSSGQAQFKEMFKDHINGFERITKYNNEFEVIVVYLNKDTTLERARSLQRNFSSYYMTDYRGHDLQAVLAAFVSPDRRWRFSLVKTELVLETSSGKTKIKNVYTPVKRWSFLAGKDENSHTAQSRFKELLTYDNDIILEHLEKAFNVEAVTKDFFLEYSKLVNRINAELEEQIKNGNVKKEFISKNIDTSEFSKKLLSQIVFLYFLQKKGWFGVKKDAKWGTGDKRYLRNLFTQNKGNYFNDILEPLFYKALAEKRKNDYYEPLNCRIPFLNGGLFEPMNQYDWQNVDINLPNTLFSSSSKTNIGDVGNGILDIFDRYNFTVCEDEPLDSEVAIDPEMLGRIFENLLESHERGASGTFYTPRTIVHYMCSESLINYLSEVFADKIKPGNIREFVKYAPLLYEREMTAFSKDGKGDYSHYISEEIRKYSSNIDQALAELLINDPAVGSGAFIVGMMTEIVKLRELLSIYFYSNLTHYDRKRNCIQHSLYGVDTSEGAVDIAKLRLWLSLVVDEENESDIQPLPNLDYKIRRGNSLVQNFGKDKRVIEGSVVYRINTIEKFINKEDDSVEELKNIYFSETDAVKKRQLKEEIDKLLNNDSKNFYWDKMFSEVFDKKNGFDIIIANPPYVQIQGMDTNDKNMYQNEAYESFVRTGDIYQLFYEKTLRLLNEHGVIALITSNKWMRATYGKSTRKLFRDKAEVISVLDLGSGRFESATVDTNIIFYRKQRTKQEEIKAYSIKNADNISTLEREKDFDKIVISQDDKSWVIVNPIEESILAKINKLGKPLKDWDIQINRGILTGCNEAFIIGGEKRAELITKDPKSDEIIRPILRGRDIKRYGYEFADLWLIFIPWHFPLHLDDSITGSSEKAESLFKIQYPAIYEHLLTYKGVLSARNKAETGIRYEWYALQRWGANYWNDFFKQKIVFKEMGHSAAYAYDTEYCFSSDTTGIITGSAVLTTPVKSLFALLNSKLIDYIYRNHFSGGKLGDEGFRYKANYMRTLPIIDNTEIFEPIIDEIIKQPNLELEHKINTIIYNLYNLTHEEIAYIENKYL